MDGEEFIRDISGARYFSAFLIELGLLKIILGATNLYAIHSNNDLLCVTLSLKIKNKIK